MKKILMLFLFSLIYTTSYGGNLIENTPISGVKKDKGHRIAIFDLDSNNKLLLPNVGCTVYIVIKDSFGNIVNIEKTTLATTGNVIFVPNEYLYKDYSMEVYKDNTLLLNHDLEESELF